jgi:hypothetical protein
MGQGAANNRRPPDLEIIPCKIGRIRESLNAFVCEFNSCLFSFRKQFKPDYGNAFIPLIPSS